MRGLNRTAVGLTRRSISLCNSLCEGMMDPRVKILCRRGGDAYQALRLRRTASGFEA
jgi:hypothetical protein